MTTFIDPRTDPDPEAERRPPRLTEDRDELEELRRLCREGRLYEVERWIQAGRPFQLPVGRPPGRSRWQSALEIALEDGNRALALLFLCNGYDPNREYHCPLDLALRARRWDLLDLLLDWDADPHQVDLGDLFDTYQTDLFEQFRTLGVDLTAGHEMAATLAHHTSNTPLFGYARRHRKDNPKIQRELNIALGYHARKGNERGVALCLWAGADPHARAPDLHYGNEESAGVSAIYTACIWGRVGILEKLGPDPEQDDFDKLYGAANSGAVIEFLARSALPQNVGAVLQRQLWGLSFNRRSGDWRTLDAIERLFVVGGRWEELSKETIAAVRQSVRKLSDHTFVKLMKLLATNDYCSPDILHDLARTPAMRRRMKEVGFIPPDLDAPNRHRWRQNRPTRFREVLKKFGVGVPRRSKPKRPLSRTVHIGRWRRDGRGIRMTREELFERMWSKPAYKLAEEWGLSGTGLRKACKRLKVPTPGRGYWQKVKAGKRVRQPKLPELPEGEAEEIVVWAPK